MHMSWSDTMRYLRMDDSIFARFSPSLDDYIFARFSPSLDWLWLYPPNRRMGFNMRSQKRINPHTRRLSKGTSALILGFGCILPTDTNWEDTRETATRGTERGDVVPRPRASKRAIVGVWSLFRCRVENYCHGNADTSKCPRGIQCIFAGCRENIHL
jgi:hypothetical protein